MICPSLVRVETIALLPSGPQPIQPGVGIKAPVHAALADPKGDLARHATALQQQAIEFIPPILLIAADVAAGHEHRARHAESLHRWPGDQKVIDVAIVEGDDDAPRRHATSLERGIEFPQPHRRAVGRDDTHVSFEMLGLHAYTPRIAR